MVGQYCAECGGSNLVGPFAAMGESRIHMKIPNPTNLFRRTSSFSCIICIDCGNVRMFIDEKGLKNLRESMFKKNLEDYRVHTCPSCDSVLIKNMKFCHNCGYPVSTNESRNKDAVNKPT